MANEDIFASLFAQPEDKGTIGHVMDVLSYVDRPDTALYGGLMNALYGTSPDETFWEGFKKGGYGQTDYHLSDVLGLPRTTSEDDWLSYLAKGGINNIVNFLGSPLTWAFTPAKAAGILPRIAKGVGIPEGRSLAGLLASPATDPLMEKIAGSSLGKAFMHELPQTGGKYGQRAAEIEADILSGGRVAGEGAVKAQELADISRKVAKESGLDPLVAEELFQRSPEELKAQAPALFDAMVNQLGLKTETFGAKSAAREARGYDPLKMISQTEEYPNFWTRQMTEEGRRAAQQGVGGIKFNMEPGASRELVRVVEPTGKLVNPQGLEKPVVTKESYLTKTPEGGYLWTNPETGIESPVKMVQATRKDITESGILPAKHFLEDPFEAMRIATQKDLTHTFFLDTVGKAIEAGDIVPLSEMVEGMRPLKVPGLTEFAARKSVANRFENLAYSTFDPETPIGALGETLKTFNKSYLGEKLGQFTNLWKGTTLPLHPGWLAGNLVSGLFQAGVTGGVNPAKLPLRIGEAIATAAGKGEGIVPQLKQAGLDLLHEAKIRDINPSTGLFGSTGQEIAEAGPGLFGRLGELPPFKQIGQLQSAGYKVGGAQENVQKLAVFIDQLKDLPKDFATLPKEAQGRLLDAAAAKAQSALIDYGPSGGWTGLEKQLMSIIPFYKWQRGLAGQTLEALTEYPQRLSATSRALDTFLTPMSNEDKNIMDPWAKEQSPITGILGHSFGTDERGMPQMALAGRFLPWGNVEQFAKRPMDFLESIVNPAIKSPIELGTNYSAFKNRPIDELAGGFPYSLTAPITGGPYQKASSQIFGWTPPAAVEYIASQMPGGRYLREANELARATGLVEDKYKEPNADMDSFLAWYTTGGKAYPFDRMAAFQRRSKEQDKQTAAIKHDLNYAVMKGDTARIEQDILMSLEQEKTKSRALGFIEY